MTTPIVPYDPLWPDCYQCIRDKIIKACPCIDSIEYTGSTAIPGLSGKPKIDVLVRVKDLVKAHEYMLKAGFVYRGEFNIPLHIVYDPTPQHEFPLDSNIHFYEWDCPEPLMNKRFQNALMADSNLRDEYAKLKEKNARDPDSRQVYLNGIPKYNYMKSDFIRRVITATGFQDFHVKFAHYEDDLKFLTKSFGSYDETDYKFVLSKGYTIVGAALIDQNMNLKKMHIDDQAQNNAAKAYLETRLHKWIQYKRKIIK